MGRQIEAAAQKSITTAIDVAAVLIWGAGGMRYWQISLRGLQACSSNP